MTSHCQGIPRTHVPCKFDLRFKSQSRNSHIRIIAYVTLDLRSCELEMRFQGKDFFSPLDLSCLPAVDQVIDPEVHDSSVFVIKISHINSSLLDPFSSLLESQLIPTARLWWVSGQNLIQISCYLWKEGTEGVRLKLTPIHACVFLLILLLQLNCWSAWKNSVIKFTEFSH